MIKDKKIFIAGSGGMLGEAFYKVFGKQNIIKCTDKDKNEDWIDYLDFFQDIHYFISKRHLISPIILF